MRAQDREPETEIVSEALAAARAAQAPVDDIVGMEQYNTLSRRVFVIYLPLAVFVFVLLFPFYWMAITAVKPDHQLTNYTEYSPFWVVGPTLDHIKYLFLETSYPGVAVEHDDRLGRLDLRSRSRPPSSPPTRSSASASPGRG